MLPHPPRWIRQFPIIFLDHKYLMITVLLKQTLEIRPRPLPPPHARSLPSNLPRPRHHSRPRSRPTPKMRPQLRRLVRRQHLFRALHRSLQNGPPNRTNRTTRRFFFFFLFLWKGPSGVLLVYERVWQTLRLIHGARHVPKLPAACEYAAAEVFGVRVYDASV